MRRTLVLSLLLLSASVFAQSPRKPNVLFIISDDLTTTALSCYENQACHTPNIDRLASEGVRFTRSYSQFPVCGPSRASLLFGYYPHATETFGYVSGRAQVGPTRKSLPQLFKDNGYYTARVSKIFHMGIPGDIEKGTDGADDKDSWTETFNSQASEWKAAGESELVQNNSYGKLDRKGGNVMTIVKAEGDDLVHADGKTAAKASELIRKHKNEPFFLAVGLVRPHVPFVAPKGYFKPYPYQQMVLPPQVQNDWDDIPQQGINYVTSQNAQMSEDQEKKAIAGYYASVSFMDAQVGKILQTLREEGLEDNTIVIFTSDHGFHLGEHRFWMKVSLKEESARVPLIIKVPGKAPAVCHSLVELLDLYPTVAGLAGLQASPRLQGKNLSELLDDPEKEVRSYAFSVSSWNKKFSFLLRSQKWAFIQYGEDGAGGIELFDMEYDEKQFNNLANNPRYQQQVNLFKKELKNKLQAVRTNDLGKTYR
ncbi:arylsulfatase A-like enzyme [Anseongella ginsenosidimutans]|uniref:Arylsulfatase A-like enzyme n=1 Tax=Anseongella ginsenosidimutans TaxID=496056 RepID=A0A4R3KMY5_9SPHI|nr:sulfatase [Anseongella ginsenosidimutans]QEC52544.1 sulfatase [Anseongella ginsenosidimutans]TCS85272.1 arylsulfatase A-like enzyme [Anseongella ginsenosidimutans]